jgi:hypothetical protein
MFKCEVSRPAFAMYETVSEPIEVLVAFRRERVEPMTFKWANRYYQIKKISLIHSERQGREKVTYFSVLDAAANAYRLSFSSERMQWRLEEMATI